MTAQRSVADPAFSGDYLRTLRAARDLSLRALAESAGLSASLLSQIERGAANPTLDSMQRIARSLDVSIFDLFETGARPTAVIRPDRRRRVVIRDGDLTYELLSPDTHRHMEVWQGRLTAGSKMGEEPSTHSSEEFILVLQGRMRLELAGQTYDLDTGCSIQYDGNLPHLIHGVGDGDLLFLSALTPPTL